MEIYVSLFGKKQNVLSWLTLLEQEKVPFKYKGEDLNNFSSINILVGFSRKKVKILAEDEEDKIYIVEPKAVPSREKLIERFSLLNLPYMHLWYYPTDSPSIFLFRVDVDYVYMKGLENIFEITKKFNIKGTYFVNISGEEEFDEKISHLKLKKPTTPQRKEILQRILLNNNEIANHGYWHFVFKDFKRNYQNINNCNLFLKKLFKVKNKGFAAPGGELNNSLIKAINQARLLYSSNELGKGGFPYYPSLQNKKMKTLEIPVYYLCDASFESFSPYCQDILKNSYLRYIEEQINNNKPITILGHPHIIGKVAQKFFVPIFKKLKELNIPNYTFKEFANWWKKREKIKISYKKSGDKLIITANRYPVLIEIIWRRGAKIIKIRKRSIINLKNWENEARYS